MSPRRAAFPPPFGMRGAQIGNYLGERLLHAIAGAFARSARTLLVVSDDCRGREDSTHWQSGTSSNNGPGRNPPIVSETIGG